jgi:hypothetical protein
MSTGNTTFTLPVENLDEAKHVANSKDPDLYTFPTLRDTFAMAAVSGILANQNTQQNTPHYVADEAYNIADAMFERRKK